MPSALKLLFVSSFPASPATFGAQRRLEGLMRSLASRNRVSFVGLCPPDFDRDVAYRAMREYCDEVVLVPCREAAGRSKRISQLRSLGSTKSYERRYMNQPGLQRELDRILRARPFDVVSVETPFMAFSRFRSAPPGHPPPHVIVDAHNVEFDLARQYGEMSTGLSRRVYHALNWRKLRREELRAWRMVDGVAFTSPDDEARARAFYPEIRSAVVPNGVDTEQFRPRNAAPDARPTLLFFGTMNYFPNLDAVRWLLGDIWPRIAKRSPDVRLKIIGSHPPPDVLAQHGPDVEIAGLVDDLQRHLAEATAIIVPLRIGGGTRLKILESLAMGKAIVSTALGAEGIALEAERHILIADDPEAFSSAALRLLEDPALAHRLGDAGRKVVETTYSWAAIAERMEGFLRELRGSVRQTTSEAMTASG
ncbi:MAG TPA: glycosyltransferase family 4 protein [Vulgatibacter sp.]|nr:glycosyltransferase family 4 protein [Vulgatibacter sp.]